MGRSSAAAANVTRQGPLGSFRSSAVDRREVAIEKHHIQSLDAIRVLELATIDGLFETRGHMVERGKVADAARLGDQRRTISIDVLDYIFDCAREHVSLLLLVCGASAAARGRLEASRSSLIWKAPNGMLSIPGERYVPGSIPFNKRPEDLQRRAGGADLRLFDAVVPESKTKGKSLSSVRPISDR